MIILGRKNRFVYGFTLIELLVVVSIIGILATLLVANYNATRERARDAQRKSDLRNIQTALRVYYNDRGSYPLSSSGKLVACGAGGTSVCNWGESFSVGSVVYMNILPKDPSSDRSYYYNYDSTTGEYTLQACLENAADEKCKKDGGGNLVTCTGLPTGGSGCIYEVRP